MIPAFTIELDNGFIGPAWTLEVALDAANEAEASGKIAIRVWQGGRIVLDGESLKRSLVAPRWAPVHGPYLGNNFGHC